MINNKLVLSILLITYYVSNPILEWRNYQKNLLNGKYPVTEDSIGLPMGLYLITWSVGFLLVALFLLAIYKTSLEKLSLFSLNYSRPLLSILISVVVIFFIAWDSFFILEQFFETDLINLLHSILEIYLLMCLRVVFIFYGRKLSNALENN